MHDALPDNGQIFQQESVQPAAHAGITVSDADVDGTRYRDFIHAHNTTPLKILNLNQRFVVAMRGSNPARRTPALVLSREVRAYYLPRGGINVHNEHRRDCHRTGILLSGVDTCERDDPAQARLVRRLVA